jgi:hypothetical protein
VPREKHPSDDDEIAGHAAVGGARGRPASVPVASQRTYANALRLSTGGPPSALHLDPHFGEARAWHAFTNWISLDSGFSNDGTLLYEAEAELQRAVRDEPPLARALTIHRTDEDALHFLMQYHHYTGIRQSARPRTTDPAVNRVPAQHRQPAQDL